MTTKIELAAKVYAKKQHVKIQDMKGLHGKTQLYYAFMAGAESIEMKWIPFYADKCPVNTTLIFFREGKWFSGIYRRGAGPHGYTITRDTEPATAEGITHYLIPTLPQ